MEPTIFQRSNVIVDYRAYATAEPARFDIVVFHPPGEPDKTFAFRIAGLPGETIEISRGAISIDGRAVSVPSGLTYEPAPTGTNSARLGPSEFFLLGDNTANARDSRFFGPVDKGNILGKVIRIEQPPAGDRLKAPPEE